MSEGAPRKNQEMVEFAAWILEVTKNQERFPFAGIDPQSYAKAKAEEEEFPGFATPIDTLIARFRAEGMKVVLSPDAASGNIYILPAGSDDIENDSLIPRHLLESGIMDGHLKVLVRISKNRKW